MCVWQIKRLREILRAFVIASRRNAALTDAFATTAQQQQEQQRHPDGLCAHSYSLTHSLTYLVSFLLTHGLVQHPQAVQNATGVRRC